jgi:hypothetical protein
MEDTAAIGARAISLQIEIPIGGLPTLPTDGNG